MYPELYSFTKKQKCSLQLFIEQDMSQISVYHSHRKLLINCYT
jgi:hypothetical protein